MQTLNPQQLIKVWALGTTQSPIDRALTLLSLALPNSTYDELARLSIGERNSHLSAIREHYFGSTMVCLADCTICKEPLEFTLDTALFNKRSNEVDIESLKPVVLEDYYFRFRILNSVDLKQAALRAEVQPAQRILLQRCIVAISYQDTACSIEEVPETVLQQFADYMQQIDPLAQIIIQMNCPACSNKAALTFDIAAFLWEELNAKAKQILNEVHELAYAYGWSEDSILAMSTAHRQFYLTRLMQ